MKIKELSVMKSRNLLKEIPAGKFHSVLFTTYSINLYYLEQQVLPCLSSKGIHYVSIFVDSYMLSGQLENYSRCSQNSRRTYAIHGIKSRGAFHPKIIFLAGDNCILVLIGSGNLTISGHGKNLEVWHPIYVDTVEHPAYGLIHEVWKYLNRFSEDLGDTVSRTFNTIKENCCLLSSSKEGESGNFFKCDTMDAHISFHTSRADFSLFEQLSRAVGDEPIRKITLMAPYFDGEGKFITQLNERFRPREIDIIVQTGFGALPRQIYLAENVRFFDWKEMEWMQGEDGEEKLLTEFYSFFHAKNLILQGEHRSFLMSGSANGSVAAFGTSYANSVNEEACLLYESSSVDFHKLLGIEKKGDPVDIYHDERFAAQQQDDGGESSVWPVFISAADINHTKVTVCVVSEKDIRRCELCFCDPNGEVAYKELLSLQKGNNDFIFSLAVSEVISVCICKEDKVISNRQYLIDLYAFERTNPCHLNRELNRVRQAIGAGDFSSLRIIDYLHTIYQQKNKFYGSNAAEGKKDRYLSTEQDSAALYVSYEVLAARAERLSELIDPSKYTEYHGVRLWDSIWEYLKRCREEEVQRQADIEQTEVINGWEDGSVPSEKEKPKKRKPIQRSTFEGYFNKVKRYLNRYENLLLGKVYSKENENYARGAPKPTLIDLAMYLIVMELLLLLSCHKERIDNKEGEDKEEFLLIRAFQHGDSRWSEYLLRFVGLFTRWVIATGGFEEIPGQPADKKLSEYKQHAFRSTVAAMVLFKKCSGEDGYYDIEKLHQWLILSLLNAGYVFKQEKEMDETPEGIMELIPAQVREEWNETILTQEIEKCLPLTKFCDYRLSKVTVGEFHFLKKVGFVVQKGSSSRYFHPSGDWDKSIGNYNMSI